MMQTMVCPGRVNTDRRSAAAAPILAIHGTNGRVLQYAQNMRDVMPKNASGADAVNRQYICGFHAIGGHLSPKFMQKSASSPLIAFCSAVLSF
jgi:hypothetical protein